MKLLLLSLLSGFFLLACSPAEFSTVPDGTDAQLSLLNGNTVEIVGTDELDQVLDQPSSNDLDIGVNDDNGSTTPPRYPDRDGGAVPPNIGSDGRVVAAPVNCKQIPAVMGGEDYFRWLRLCGDEQDQTTYCRMIPTTTGPEFLEWIKRCMVTRYEDKKDDNKIKHEVREPVVVVTPDQLLKDKGALDIIGCGNGKKDKKVSVCHHPAGDYNKRKTLCVGAPALKAFIRMNGKRSNKQTKNYAGVCTEEVAE